MLRKKNCLLFLFCWLLPAFVLAEAQVSYTIFPNASLQYQGEGKIMPQSYVNRVGKQKAPLHCVDISQAFSQEGYWRLALWHTGPLLGGEFASETVPDNTTNGIYQTNKLHVGFTNIFITRQRPLADWPVEMRFSLSVVQQTFVRKNFVVQGVDGQGMDVFHHVSAEGFGFGLSGRHGERFYAHWQADAHIYMMLFDAKTDAFGGHIFQTQGGAGIKCSESISLESGFFWQYWFIPDQGDRRLSLPGTDGAVISWNRQETRIDGLFFRLVYRFSKTPRR